MHSVQNQAVGRKPGEVSMALLQAVQRLASGSQGATLQELAVEAGVALSVACQTLKNMHRYGKVCIAGYRRVNYRNRPVAEYVLPAMGNAQAVNDGTFLQACWR